jgi:serine/threonine-protein kinase HipA
MTSEFDALYSEAYVWVWLPDATEPVVAGLLTRHGQQLVFNYGRSYLARPDAISLYAPELPLQSGSIPLIPGLNMPSCLRDASPDAWGRRVLINRKFGVKGVNAAEIELDELTYLLESGSDRIGALDFQQSPTHHVPRQSQQHSLEALLTAADKVERGVALPPELDQALLHSKIVKANMPRRQRTHGDARQNA